MNTTTNEAAPAGEFRVEGTIGDELGVSVWRTRGGSEYICKLRTYGEVGDDDFTGEIDIPVEDLDGLVQALILAKATADGAK